MFGAQNLCAFAESAWEFAFCLSNRNQGQGYSYQSFVPYVSSKRLPFALFARTSTLQAEFENLYQGPRQARPAGPRYRVPGYPGSRVCIPGCTRSIGIPTREHGPGYMYPGTRTRVPGYPGECPGTHADFKLQSHWHCALSAYPGRP